MWLLFVAVLSFVVPNGLLLYWLLHDFTTLQAALQNRLALAFILDVFLTTGVLAAYFAKVPPGRYGWPWFVAFSLLGTLGFGLAFYWWLSKRPSGDATATELTTGWAFGHDFVGGNNMVEITIEGDKAVFQVQGWDRLWSLRSRLEIPLRHIDGVDADPKPAMGWFQGFRVAGANIPNIFKAGIFYQEGNLVFWDVQNPEKTIVVELADERFAKLIVEVPAPDVAVSVIKNAMAHAKA